MENKYLLNNQDLKNVTAGINDTNTEVDRDPIGVLEMANPVSGLSEKEADRLCKGGTIKPPDGDPEWWHSWNPTPVIDPEHGPLNK